MSLDEEERRPEWPPSVGWQCKGLGIWLGFGNATSGGVRKCSPLPRGWKGKVVSDSPANSSCVGCGGRNPFLSSSSWISEEGPLQLVGRKRKGRKHIRISKGIKGMHFLLSVSGIQQEVHLQTSESTPHSRIATVKGHLPTKSQVLSLHFPLLYCQFLVHASECICEIHL